MPTFPECRSLQRELTVVVRICWVPTQGRGDFLTFKGLLSCFLTLLSEVEKMSGILVLTFHVLLQRRGCFKGQNTRLGMKKPCFLVSRPVSAGRGRLSGTCSSAQR